MFELENKDFITSCISIINIITTISLSIVNYIYLRKNRKQAEMRDTFIKYYLPMLTILLPIQNEFKKAQLINKDFDIFNPNPSSDEDRKNRHDIIDIYYNHFLEEEKKLPYSYYNKKIDSVLFLAKKHMQFMVSISGQERIIDISELKKHFPVPDFDELINLITAVVFTNTI